MKRILLTGARAPVTLDLARQFHRRGHDVFLADSVRWPIAWPSRAVRRTFHVARPAHEPARFVDDLVELVRRHRIDLVVPTCEEIFYVAARHEAFDGLAKLFAEPLERLASLHDKWEFVRLVEELADEVRAPETMRIDEPGQLAPWASSLDPSAWVFKPVYSRFAARTAIGPDRDRLARLQPTAADPWVAQRRVCGQEYSTYSVARGGKLRAHACYRSEYRVGLGAGIYFVNHVDARIRRFVERFVARLSFTGQIAFDLIDADDGRMYVLECNPRATNGLHLLDETPLADAFLNDATPGDGESGEAGPAAVLEPTSSRPVMVGPVMILFAAPAALRGWRFGKFCRDMLGARDVMLRRDDPWPALLAPLSLAEVARTAWRTGKALTAASTFDIEWNGEPLRAEPLRAEPLRAAPP